ncbi:hypothetical protein AEGHOMDF_1733 [Methylobacterium soli]|nr:hypothetical protein AEGHOMDF_1733 [Methylobacterium soli]
MGRHLLAIGQHAEPEQAGRREVLQQAEGGELHPLGGGREPDQRQRRRHPGQGQEPEGLAVARGRLRGPGPVGEREGGEQQGLGQEPDHRIDADDLPDQPVEGEAGRQRQGQPGQGPGHGDRHDHARRRDHHGGDLHRAQALAEHRGPEGDADEGVDVVAEARVEQVAAIHRGEVEQPVHPDEGGGGREPSVPGPQGKRAAQAGAPQGYQGEGEQARPDDALGQDQAGAEMAEQPEMHRDHEAPAQIGTERVDEAHFPSSLPARRVRRGHARRVRRGQAS